MLEKLKQMADELQKTGESHGVHVIDIIWNDGGGAPVFLEDVIEALEKDNRNKFSHI